MEDYIKEAQENAVKRINTFYEECGEIGELDTEEIIEDAIKSVLTEARKKWLEEGIVKEKEQFAFVPNCNGVDGRVQSECFKQYNRACDWNEVVRRHIARLEAELKALTKQDSV